VLAHGPAQLDGLARKGNIMRLNGIDADLLDRGEVMRLLPYLDLFGRGTISDSRRTAAATRPAPCGMMQLPGVMRALPHRWGWTSSNTVRSLVS